MRKSSMWAILGAILVTTMLLLSCQSTPSATQTGQTIQGTVATPTTAATSIAPPVTAAATTPSTTASGTPKYGGTLTLVSTIDPQDFDQAYRSAWYSFTLDYTNETLMTPDITKGPAGTGEIGLGAYPQYPDKYFKGMTLESWDFTSPVKWVLHVRKGVNFQSKAPVNGREMVADDVATSIQRVFSEPGGWLYAMAIKPTISVQDKYTVVLDWPSYDASMWFRIADTIFIVPKELVRDASNKENQLLRDWHNANGTGPWMLMDWVKGSSLTFKKNPNYWGTDPFHPENRLPYMDQITTLIIPDSSTSLAALRTHKLDVRGVAWSDVPPIDKSNPELKKRELYANYSLELTPRNDIAPFNDVRVRQALSMAINRQTIINDLMGGHATYLNRMFCPYDIGVYVGYDQLPADIKDTLTYNLDKAKKLLADAGLANGFATSVMYVSTTSQHEEVSTLIKADWEKIGVKLTLDPRESSVFTTITYGRTFPGLQIWGYGNATALNCMDCFHTGHYSNIAGVVDPNWDKMQADALATVDEATRDQKMKDLSNYMLKNMWVIPLPTPSTFIYWQPWIQQWAGAYMTGTYHYIVAFRCAWIDPTVKSQYTSK